MVSTNNGHAEHLHDKGLNALLADMKAMLDPNLHTMTVDEFARNVIEYAMTLPGVRDASCTRYCDNYMGGRIRHWWQVSLHAGNPRVVEMAGGDDAIALVNQCYARLTAAPAPAIAVELATRSEPLPADACNCAKVEPHIHQGREGVPVAIRDLPLVKLGQGTSTTEIHE